MDLNRIIILGNGFDLAHNLKTKYSDFITDYYSNIKDSSYKDEFLEFKIPGYLFEKMNSLNEMTQHMSDSLGDCAMMHPEMNLHFDRKLGVVLRNYFFYEISKKHESKWVDIEVEYFNKLLKIIDKNETIKTLEEIAQLNYEVDLISEKFEKYLIEKVNPEIKQKFNERIAKLFSSRVAIDELQFNAFLKELPQDFARLIDESMQGAFSKGFCNIHYNETLILNFNYTNTASELYRGYIADYHTIDIHGDLENKKNPLNLGFGDEMHSRYPEIEEANENEYLRLMKSFAYLNTDNYRKLFNFIESNDFQVQIMGHSCGISDRTLLNAIFENDKCKSIKVFYHKSSNGTDNYSDLVRSISRHFNKKLVMRNKIVNKTLCKELPQLINE